MILTIDYSYGKGHCRIDLSELLPVTSANMNRLVSILEMSADPYCHAETIYKYISGRIQELQEKRAAENGRSKYGQKNIAKHSAEIKKFIANSRTLSRQYGFPEIADQEAEIRFTSRLVYPIRNDQETRRPAVFPENGWMFEKAGFQFEVYAKKTGKYTEYVVMLSETGAQCATAGKKKETPAAVTEEIIKILQSKEKEIAHYRESWKRLMIAAGYMEPERCENISEEQEPETIRKEYSISPTGTIVVFENGERTGVYTPESPEYETVLEAANKERIENGKEPYRPTGTPENHSEPERCETISDQADQIEQEPETEPSETIQAETDQEPAETTTTTERGKVPEKTFIGTRITGKGYQIFFDPDTNRTRVIFDHIPGNAEKETVKAAGFWYSANLKSWNKKLTFKAYRAAVKLHETLETMAG